MRLLLDESLPRRLKQELSSHEVVTVPEMGWAAKSNGELLSLAEGQFQVFLTADQGLQFQVNLSRAEISIVVLAAHSNRFEDLKPLISQVLAALESIQPVDVVRVAA
ncbi:MAG: DUF5615 family PIN-like protein [Chloroflexi bacterium]|nr:DUF5615 family PIN-like protein [Chloroflexota bacterium]